MKILISIFFAAFGGCFIYAITETINYNVPKSNSNKLKQSSLDTMTITHLALGKPIDIEDTLNNEILISRKEYALSYSPSKGAPNWVAWELNQSWMGDIKRRKGKFLSDPKLPDSLKIYHDDYTNSGFDRGHVVRSKERTNSKASNKATFYMSNVMPQTPDLNRGVWLKLERHCEKLASKGHQLYMVCGGIYHDTTTLHHEGKVMIPDSCYKAVISIAPNKKDTAFFGVIMPNIRGVRSHEWNRYSVSLKQIEKSAGYDFFPLLE